MATLLLLITSKTGNAQKNMEQYWSVSNGGISWNLTGESRLPHHDNIEMDGQKVAAIISYSVNEQKIINISRKIIFPQFRRYLTAAEPDYLRFRAYLQDDYEDNILPAITIGTTRFQPGPVDSIHIDGKLTVYHKSLDGISVVRQLFPAMTTREFVEIWTLANSSDSTKDFYAGSPVLNVEEKGVNGTFRRQVRSDVPKSFQLAPGNNISFAVYISAANGEEELPPMNFSLAEAERNHFLDTVTANLQLTTPDPVVNTLFKFSKIRAAESIYQTSMGLVHSPGGGRYYAGVWANDQAEYVAPFFPYLGYNTGIEAARNIYRMFLKNIPPKGKKMWSSFEMNGELPCCSVDRGDAAMIANGLTLFLLTVGDKKDYTELSPLLEWSLDYCDSKKNEAGVISSESDELEGRFPSGNANLSTSSLYYGALRSAEMLAVATGRPAIAESYRKKAATLKAAIEQYFGADMEGLKTYRYYKENTTLRSWICLPLVVGLNDRKEGTLSALFEKLWTDNGTLVELSGDSTTGRTFWDRSTLYAFRGAFKAGAADLGEARLREFSRQRLLGFHVPYVVEAWPEGDMAHLSAESALYCRIFTEGLLAMEPTGFNKFTFAPYLPSGWKNLTLKNIRAFNTSFDIEVKRKDNFLLVDVVEGNHSILRKQIKPGETVAVIL